MRRVVSLAALTGALLLLYTSGVLAQPQGPTQNIPDQYIVVFEEGVRDPAAAADEHARENGLRVGFVYANALEGYAAVFPNDRALQRVQNDPRVAYVEQDQVARAVAQTLPWGIDRVDADTSSTLAGNSSGGVPNVNAYVIDTGIYRHADLNVVGHVNFAGGKNTDCNGHGTHVAGTVAAKDNTSDVVGVAPGAPLTGVKVLGCNGSGSYSGVIKGVDWVTANAKKPAIANMSLGGPVSQALDDAVTNSAAGGVFYSLAAGNDGADACASSPARVGAGTDNGIATVAATNKEDGETSWSNYGSCVDVWAPGASILSTKKGGGTTTMSGTSMAAPHVGGGGALYLANNTDASPSTVEGALRSSATTTANKSKDGAAIVREYVGGF
ncbi:MAG: S8 family peptidase [Actinomycetota bacterium]|nr:S8 family peptidase [Actinomycetota bacterium]